MGNGVHVIWCGRSPQIVFADKLLLLIVIEHAIVITKRFLEWLLPDMPPWLLERKVREGGTPRRQGI